MEAAALLRKTRAASTRMAGSDDEGTLAIEGRLLSALLDPGEYAEAEALCRGMLGKLRRVLDPNHRDTTISSGNLASSLS